MSDLPENPASRLTGLQNRCIACSPNLSQVYDVVAQKVRWLTRKVIFVLFVFICECRLLLTHLYVETGRKDETDITHLLLTTHVHVCIQSVTMVTAMLAWPFLCICIVHSISWWSVYAPAYVYLFRWCQDDTTKSKNNKYILHYKPLKLRNITPLITLS
jgi:hypothetical protein